MPGTELGASDTVMAKTVTIPASESLQFIREDG